MLPIGIYWGVARGMGRCVRRFDLHGTRQGSSQMASLQGGSGLLHSAPRVADLGLGPGIADYSVISTHGRLVGAALGGFLLLSLASLSLNSLTVC